MLHRSMLPPGPGTSGTPREEVEELYPVIVEHSAQPGDRRRQEQVSIHRRNISTLASPVILVFDGFHNIVYHLYLATRYLLSMALLLLRLALTEIMKPADRTSLSKGEFRGKLWLLCCHVGGIVTRLSLLSHL